MKLGLRGERGAGSFLRRKGYRIVARNYRCPPGEIDLIAMDGDTLVFVEVKTRRDAEAADPEANITPHKRRKLTQAARYYLMTHAAEGRPARFDVVSVLMPEGSRPQFEHFVDAFAPAGR